jgi:hypothetical protein
LRLQLLDTLGDLFPLAGDDLEAIELDGVEKRASQLKFCRSRRRVLSHLDLGAIAILAA